MDACVGRALGNWYQIYGGRHERGLLKGGRQRTQRGCDTGQPKPHGGPLHPTNLKDGCVSRMKLNGDLCLEHAQCWVNTVFLPVCLPSSSLFPSPTPSGFHVFSRRAVSLRRQGLPSKESWWTALSQALGSRVTTVTAKTAFLFILPQYNVSVPTADSETVHYHYGPKDLVTILFYVFITIILHAVVQEYILDKISKRLHLSKVKHSKFNESGQLVIFHLSSVVWSFYVVVTEGYLTNPRSLWEDYPHVCLPFQVKFFYLCQLAYWLHALPELYFQKVRKEEIPRQLQYICLYLAHIAGAYLLNLSRLGLILLLLQYCTESLFHMARLFYFADENNEKLFNAWAAVFGVTRLFILTLAVLAIGFGLARMENQAFDPEKGNFNTLLCRLCVLLLVCAAQAWLMWRFIHSQLRHWREYWNEQSAKRRVPAAPRLPARLIKRESGYHENGVVKAENGTSPRTKKLKSP
uniref:translocating chain-associated membrane protein 2 isoform X1 n=1 Tax=Halichoerus grypus TaxID=9711 RepID=UPI001659BD08|nr:translocating chain-associated membrane protein 2 isoform X1 [Halichoerus grypus]